VGMFMSNLAVYTGNVKLGPSGKGKGSASSRSAVHMLLKFIGVFIVLSVALTRCSVFPFLGTIIKSEDDRNM